MLHLSFLLKTGQLQNKILSMTICTEKVIFNKKKKIELNLTLLIFVL